MLNTTRTLEVRLSLRKQRLAEFDEVVTVVIVIE